MNNPEPDSSPVGPVVVCAVLCDQVIEAKDGTLTLIRLISKVTVNVERPLPKRKNPPVNVPISGLFALNACGRPGEYDVALVLITPSGQRRPARHTKVELPHDYFTMNFVLKAEVGVTEEGVYWIALLVDGRELTRTPLEVLYTQTQTERTKPSEGVVES